MYISFSLHKFSLGHLIVSVSVVSFMWNFFACDFWELHVFSCESSEGRYKEIHCGAAYRTPAVVCGLGCMNYKYCVKSKKFTDCHHFIFL